MAEKNKNPRPLRAENSAPASPAPPLPLAALVGTTVVDSSEDAIISQGLDGIVTSWNGSAELLFGYAAEEIVGKPGTLLLPGDRLAEGRDILSKVANGQQVLHFETVRRRRDGTTVGLSLSISPILDAEGTVIGASTIARDITAEKQARIAAAHLAAIVESSDDAIVSKTLEGIVTSWNRGAERLFGFSAPEMLGQSITRIIPADRLGEEAHILSRISRGEPVKHFESVRRRKDGSLVDISLTISPIRDPEGRIIGASKVARDITERRKAEERARELNETLEARVRERTAEMEAFSYTIAHDLRAPLRAMHRYSEVLREEYAGRLDPEGLDFLHRMAEGAARMDRLIEDLLSYSRIARVETRQEPVSVGEILNEIRAEMGRELEVRRCDLAGEGELPEVLGDRVLLKQALSNLISNAVKFVGPGVAPVVRVAVDLGPRLARIRVRDNGIGIDVRYHDRIFKIFERLTAGDTYPGTGVGLAIVKKAVERMNGTIGLESKPGQGSCFWIELARVDPE